MGIDNKKLIDYAKVIVRVGVNVQKNQPVVISAIVESIPLVRCVVNECYKAGASKVHVRFDDGEITKMHYINQSARDLTIMPAYEVDYLAKPVIAEGACRISIRGSSPDLLKGVDSQKVQAYQKARSIKLKPLTDWIMSAKCQWTIACWPSVDWARIVFPKLSPEKAVEKLWDAILLTVRVDGKTDPIKAWDNHNNETEKRAQVLNDYNFDYIHCENSLGTNIDIKLIKDHIWLSGREKDVHNQWKAQFTANLPTEEVWTMPDKYGLNGTVYSSKPLSVHGNIVDKFWFKFKNGKVVDFDAKVGKDTLANVLKTDVGSNRTGEIALVPVSSPVNQTKVMFYSTLFDENAACHIALGASYPNNIKNGTAKTRSELAKLGSNDSLIHVDFMFGTDDLDIVGGYNDKKKQPVVISKKGKLMF